MEKVNIENLTESVLTLRVLRTGKPLPVLPKKSVEVETVKLIPEAYNILNSNVSSGMIKYNVISAVKSSADKAYKAAQEKKDAQAAEADKLAEEQKAKEEAEKKAAEEAKAQAAKKAAEDKAKADAAKKAEEEKKAAEAAKSSKK